MKTLLILSAVVPLSLLMAPRALADGGFVSRYVATLREPEQKGIILYRDGQEELILEVQYEGRAEDFAWLVPLPACPDISVGAPDVFDDVGMQIRAWQPPTTLNRATRPLPLGRVPRPAPEPRTSIWDFTVLPPEHNALHRWLRERDITPSQYASAVLDSYVRKGWHFVGMTIGAAGRNPGTTQALARGTIEPVRFRFAAAEPVFPLRISAINPDFSDITLYIYSDRALVNRTARLAHWDASCFGRVPLPAGLAGGIWNAADGGGASTSPRISTGGISGSPGTGHFPGGRMSPGRPSPFLTRLVARFHPYEMAEDVYFREYDPGRDLRHGDRFHRMGAITWVGTTCDRRWTRELSALALQQRVESEVLEATAWALGRLGDTEALPVLKRLAAGRPPVRWEALRSLVSLDPAGAAGLLAEELDLICGLPAGRVYRVDPVPFLIETAMALPDDVGLEAFRLLSRQKLGEGQWRHLKTAYPGGPVEVTAGAAFTAILAGHGDVAARRAIAEAVAAGGLSIAAPGGFDAAGNESGEAGSRRVIHEASLPGDLADLDSSFQSARAIPIDEDRIPDVDWPSLNLVLRIFDRQPEARDAILDAAAQGDGLSAGARSILMAHMKGGDRDKLAGQPDPEPQQGGRPG